MSGRSSSASRIGCLPLLISDWAWLGSEFSVRERHEAFGDRDSCEKGRGSLRIPLRGCCSLVRSGSSGNGAGVFGIIAKDWLRLDMGE